jgi:hypothetical protein
VGEAAQSDYEQLRSAAFDGTPLVGPSSAAFERYGLYGLIARPQASALYISSLVGATRPAWSPHHDPRIDALADGFELVISVQIPEASEEEVG